uniref:Exonuclease 1 n=1 Tax=Hirondellea gigas TaxID=1518452 RepID=A0A6A7G7Y7_9CRUS
MGITGLLPALRPLTQKCTLEKFRGQSGVIDAFAWLHRASYSCALELVLDLKPTTRYINFCMHMINLLLHFGITPIVIFDGGSLPMKAGEEQSRKRSRDDNRLRATTAYNEGDIRTAVKHCQRAVRVNVIMVRTFMQALKDKGVQYIVAPYEADAQMVFMVNNGFADFCITEDSDLLVFGARKVLFKLDREGNGELIDMDCIQEYQPVKKAKGKKSGPRDFVKTLKAFTGNNFLHTCILSGCDYLSSLPGIGLMTAQKLVRENKLMNRVFYYLKRRKKGLNVTKEYEIEFRRAELTFLHQRVYNPKTRKIVHLNPIPEDLQVQSLPADGDFSKIDDSLDFLGPPISDDLAVKMASGIINPRTLRKWTTNIPLKWRETHRQKERTHQAYSQSSSDSSKSIVNSTPIGVSSNSTPFISRKKLFGLERSPVKAQLPPNFDISNILAMFPSKSSPCPRNFPKSESFDSTSSSSSTAITSNFESISDMDEEDFAKYQESIYLQGDEDDSVKENINFYESSVVEESFVESSIDSEADIEDESDFHNEQMESENRPVNSSTRSVTVPDVETQPYHKVTSEPKRGPTPLRVNSSSSPQTFSSLKRHRTSSFSKSAKKSKKRSKLSRSHSLSAQKPERNKSLLSMGFTRTNLHK